MTLGDALTVMTIVVFFLVCYWIVDMIVNDNDSRHNGP